MNRFPYTNFHDINLDWIIKTLKDVLYKLEHLPSGGGGGGGAVDSVNGKTGTVVLTKSDIGLGSVDNVRQYSASNPPPYPVTSVNGSTGTVTVSVPSPSNATPQPTGTAAAGSSANYSRADHIHAKPSYSAADVGAVALPSSPTVGDFMVYTAQGWDAVTMAEWQGGNY